MALHDTAEPPPPQSAQGSDAKNPVFLVSVFFAFYLFFLFFLVFYVFFEIA